MDTLRPEPRKDEYLAVAISEEMKSRLKVEATRLGFRGVSPLLRALAEKFLDGGFETFEIVKPRRNTSKLRKSKKVVKS